MSSPLVSVIIPSFERFDYLMNAIESVLQQDYENFEIIVVNDASTQKQYYEVALPKQVKKIDLKVGLKQKYGFPTDAIRNEGVKKSEGKYLAFLDDDDIFIHKRVVELLNWACGSYKIIGWKFLRPDKLIYKENMESPLELGEIDTAGLCFDFSLKDQSSWNDQQFGDYHYYKSLLDKCYPHEKYFFNYVLTCTQFDNKIGNFGESEYI